jgi:diguanylate cyclase (GGDEF)-like protein/PAS domain S-box-containing protein
MVDGPTEFERGAPWGSSDPGAGPHGSGPPPRASSPDDDGEVRHTLDALRHRLALEDLLTRVASAFIHRPAHEIDAGIGEALADIGAFAGVDRAYVYVIDEDRASVELTHLWEAPGLPRRADRPRSVPLADIDAYLARLRSLEPLYVPRTADLDTALATQGLRLEPDGSRSVLVVPLADEGRLVGAIGFDSVRAERLWSDDHLAVLSSAAGIIAQALARREAEQRFGLAFIHASLGMVLTGRDGRHLQVNRAFCDLVGRPESELVGRFGHRIIHPEDLPELTARWEELLREGRDRLTAEFRILRPDGEAVWCRAHTSAVWSREGSLRYLVTHFEDITDRHRQEAELRASEERYRTLVENSPAIVSRIDRGGRLVYTSDSGGLQDRAEVWTDAIRRVVASGRRVDVEWQADVSGRRRWFQSRAVPEFDPSGRVEHVLVMDTDITALKQTEEDLAQQALHDPLTGLANRALLMDHLGVALERARRRSFAPAVLFLDLDRFKVVNDSLGHRAGDELLTGVADRLVALLRGGDVVARLGGDEFVILLEEVRDAEDAAEVAHRILRAVRDPFPLDGEEVFVTASIGIAVADPSSTPDDLLRDADAAMYRAKALGRDRVELFDAALREEATARLQLETSLRRALESGELAVFYQPEVDLLTGEVVGAEALVRWRHPTSGLLEATSFIELAEETGLILDIGAWVLGEACRQAAAWRTVQATRLPMVRVNLSARQILQPDLLAMVVAALETSGLPASALCLEITETALMADAAAGLDVLSSLRALGVQLAIDDFGTGYSSLARLKRFPVDVLKIDRSFVDGLGTDPDDTAIVTAIVGLADALGLTVTAEGVETVEQRDELVRLGCLRAQGFLFARPLSPEALSERLARYREGVTPDPAPSTGGQR